MTHRPDRRPTRRQAGFTFVELMVVVVMLGLLAGIAIPAFLGQREKADDAAAKSLLRSGATTLETHYAGGLTYSTADPSDLAQIEPNIAWQAGAGASAADNEVQVSDLGDSTYTLTTTSVSGTTYSISRDMASGAMVGRTWTRGAASGTW